MDSTFSLHSVCFKAHFDSALSLTYVICCSLITLVNHHETLLASLLHNDIEQCRQTRAGVREEHAKGFIGV